MVVRSLQAAYDLLGLKDPDFQTVRDQQQVA